MLLHSCPISIGGSFVPGPVKKLDSKTSLESIGEAESEDLFQRQVSTGASEGATQAESAIASKENHISKPHSSHGTTTATVPTWIYAIIFVQVCEQFYS